MTAVASLSVGIVEDSDEDFAVFSRVLSRYVAGAEVRRWTKAEALLEVVEERGLQGDVRPDVLIVDLSLPGIDGCELVKRVRERPEAADLPVFILSGSARQRDIDRAHEAGANAYFRKSRSSADLRELLDTIFSKAGLSPPVTGGKEPGGNARLCTPTRARAPRTFRWRGALDAARGCRPVWVAATRRERGIVSLAPGY